MKKQTRKLAACLLSLSLALGLSGTGTPAEAAKVKTVKRTCTVVVGGTRLLSNSDMLVESYTVKVAKKSILTAKKNKKDVGAIFNPNNDYHYSGVIVTGKKAGKTKVTLKTKKTKYVYTVTVLGKKKVQNAAKKALASAVKKAKAKTDSKWVYTDLNGDGIADLFDNGVMISYNYTKKKTITRETGINVNAIRSISVSKKNKTMYIDAVSGSAIYAEPEDDEFPEEDENVYPEDDPEDPDDPDDPDDPEEEEVDPYTGDDVGVFFTFNEENIFQIHHTFSLICYDHPEFFVTEEKYMSGGPFYCIGDSSFDQDDLWYESYTEADLKGLFAKTMPDSKCVYSV